MSAGGERPIIIVRRKKVVHAHHGGAWKIAFADFMTALMALFLVLWILSSSSQEQRVAVAEYFRTPLLVAMAGGDRNSASVNVIPGGGPDPTFAEGELSRIDPRQEQRFAEERKRLQNLKSRIERAIELSPTLKELKDQIRMDLTLEGLRVQLVDSEQRPMFEVGSARVAPYMRALLQTLAPMLNELPNNIQISGHTDSLPYAGGEAGYSNWDLSAERANASRRELVAGGLALEKLLRVSGMADRLPLDGVPADDPVNRRITVIVLDSTAAKAILDQGERQLAPAASSGPPSEVQAPPAEASGAATSGTLVTP